MSITQASCKRHLSHTHPEADSLQLAKRLRATPKPSSSPSKGEAATIRENNPPTAKLIEPSKEVDSIVDTPPPRSYTRTPPEFWDRLSKVPLTKRSLKELDRRTRHLIKPIHACVKATTTEISSLSKGQGPNLKQFSRYGGPDLQSIRGYPEPTHINLHTKAKAMADKTEKFATDCMVIFLLDQLAQDQNFSVLRAQLTPLDQLMAKTKVMGLSVKEKDRHMLAAGMELRRKDGIASNVNRFCEFLEKWRLVEDKDEVPNQRPNAPNALPPSESSSTTTKKSGVKTRKTSAYDGGFEQHLIDHGVYLYNYQHTDGRKTPKPSNLAEIKQRLAQERTSVSPSQFSEEAFEKFEDKHAQAKDENMVMNGTFQIISGFQNIPSRKDLLFGNLAQLTDGTLVVPKPDFYDGARPEQLDLRVRKRLGRHIVPSANTTTPLLPNLFVEGKGPTGASAVAVRQACYDGALGARGIHSIRAFTDLETMYDNNAYTITSTYQAGMLTMYTTHPTESTDAGKRTEYNMTHLGSWALIGSRKQYQEGAIAFMNARDWAKEQRDSLIEAANGQAVKMAWD